MATKLRGCPKARKVVAGELEYAKRGRFERIWPTAEGTEAADAALALLPSKARRPARTCTIVAHH
jgi:hypothetical protein